MDPMTIGMAAMAGGQVLGTALQVKGMQDEADTYSHLADVDTQVLNQNATYADEQGAEILKAGFEQGKEIRRAGTRLQSEQRAVVGASGLVVDQGSPLLVAMESARLNELDALSSEYEGQRGRTMAQRESSEFRRQGALVQYDKQLTKQRTKDQIKGTILGGAMQVAAPFVGGLGPTMAGK